MPVPHDADRPATVTVILTNYNHGRYLDTSLSAVLDQTRPADEIIVIDDGSTDDSLEVIGKYAGRHPRLRVLRNGGNRGVQFTIARAVGAATSDWIVWAAADDRLLPDFLKRGMEMVQAHPDVGVVFSQLAVFRDDTGEETHFTAEGDINSAFHLGDGPACYPPELLIERLTRSYVWLSGNTALIRYDALMNVGAFVPALEWHSDWFAFYAAALRFGACGIPETLAMMRVLPNSYSAAAMHDPRRERPVMHAVLDLLRRPDFADLRWKFRARPCLFSPFYSDMLMALATRPRDWDLLLRLGGWTMRHLQGRYRGRLGGIRLPRGAKTRLWLVLCILGARLAERLAPEHWKAGTSPPSEYSKPGMLPGVPSHG